MSVTKKRNEITVKIERDIYDDFQEVLDYKDLEVKNTINKFAKNYSAKQRFLKEYPSYIFLIKIIGNSIFIKDEKKNIIAEVKLDYMGDEKDIMKLQCGTCKTDYCPHVTFAIGSEELGELYVNLKNAKS